MEDTQTVEESSLIDRSLVDRAETDVPPTNEDVAASSTSASDHKTPLQPVLAVNNVHTEVPLNLDKNILQGMSYYRSGDVFPAEFAFRQAVKTKPRDGPEDIVATMFLGRIALDREDFSGART